MTALNDQAIIANTRIVPEGDGTVKMVCPLPDGDEYTAKAQSEDSARKHIISFCEAVRGYYADKEKRHKEDIEAKVARRKSGITEVPATQPRKVDGDPKAGVLHWYDTVQDRIDELGKLIEQYTQERNELRDQRDEFAPLVAKWRNEA